MKSSASATAAWRACAISVRAPAPTTRTQTSGPWLPAPAAANPQILSGSSPTARTGPFLRRGRPT
jgi:hypothetical protein